MKSARVICGSGEGGRALAHDRTHASQLVPAVVTCPNLTRAPRTWHGLSINCPAFSYRIRQAEEAMGADLTGVEGHIGVRSALRLLP